jgi:hypothetical protein
VREHPQAPATHVDDSAGWAIGHSFGQKALIEEKAISEWHGVVFS